MSLRKKVRRQLSKQRPAQGWHCQWTAKWQRQVTSLEATTTISGVGHKHDKDDLVAAAVEAVTEEGLSQLSFGRLAKRLDISDRMVVYYFPTKDDLISEVLSALSAELQHLLEKAFGDQRMSVEELGRRAWPVLTTKSADRIFSVFFELSGLAAAGIEPYNSFAPAMIKEWVDSLVPHIEGSNPELRRKRALGLVAQIDGLLLLRQLAGPAAAKTAATQLGFAK
jgi:AcrR family transcriptional regulator